MEEDAFDHEEPDLPEKVTAKQLCLWSSNRKENIPPQDRGFLYDDSSLLRKSEQHQQGISNSTKRYRELLLKNKERPDLIQHPNPRLPMYLQEIDIFNPELMNHATTSENCSLPTAEVIELEKRCMENEKVKAWQVAVVVNESESLIDPKWKREDEEKFVNKIKRRTEERSAHVMMGVLQQWQKTQDAGPKLKLYPALHAGETSSNPDDAGSSQHDKHTIENAGTEDGKIEEEFQYDEGIRRHSSR